ncbi:amidohydrolase family protein, partial [bacterium]|nr:amidohydrolase family protein [bacterium]
MSIETIISAARGNIPVDTLFKDVQLVNLLAAEIVRTSVAVFDGKIVGFGDYDAKVTINAKGLYLAPGLIDGHVHLESSMLSPEEFARAVVPMGTTAVIAD